MKNSPKAFSYILYFVTSATVVKHFISSSLFDLTFFTAPITSESFPTPDGSIITLSGEYFSSTSPSARLKSPTRVQHMQPEFISVICMPESLRKPPSIPISPNSFSMSTTFSPLNASEISFFIRVVFPAPRNPEIIFIFVIKSNLRYKLSGSHHKQNPNYIIAQL